MAIEEYRQAISKGISHPDVYRKLTMLLYKMGFVEDAIAEMEKAVDLSPQTDVLRIELGILYMAKDRLEKAGEQFFAALEINPGFADVYYYMGEMFLKEKDYGMAWFSARTAQRLGHRGQDLVRKLAALSQEPDVRPWADPGEDLYIRQILTETRGKAEGILKRISEGGLFEDIASIESRDPNASIGGYMGSFRLSDLHPAIAGALQGREMFSEPVIAETEKGFHIVQRIAPFNVQAWRDLLARSGKHKEKAEKNTQPVNTVNSIFEFRDIFLNDMNRGLYPD